MSARRACLPGRQAGVALVVALVILLVLTVIGVSAIMTTSMEGKMSGSMQELNRAFQAAETGTAVYFSNITTGAASLPGTTTGAAAVDPVRNVYSSYNASYDLLVNYRSSTNINGTTRCESTAGSTASRFNQRSHVSSANVGRIYHFDIQSVGQANIGARVTLTQGLCRMGNL